MENEKQLKRYIENVEKSPLLLLYKNRGYIQRGILATYAECDYVPRSPRIKAKVIAEKEVIRILKKLREKRQI
jgi:hypothetical protein